MTTILAGCDTGNPSVDHLAGHGESIAGQTAQVIGGAIVTAPDVRTKITGGALIAVGVALEEDGLARMERADAAESR